MFLHRKMFGVFTPIHTGKKNCPMKKIFLIRVERSTKQNFFLFHKEFFFPVWNVGEKTFSSVWN